MSVSDVVALVEQVSTWQRRFHQVPQPALADAAPLRERVRAELGHELPDDYVALLGLVNGIDWNGFVLFASETSPIAGREGKRPRYIQGIVEQNAEARASGVIVLGETGHATYVVRGDAKQFETRDRASGDVIATHGSFGEMLAAALEIVKPPG